MTTVGPPCPAGLTVEVVYSPRSGEVDRTVVQLPVGATVEDALRASGVRQRNALAEADVQVGVWGRACDRTRVLRDHDRVELYRALLVDPKEARRQRQRQQPPTRRKAVSGSPRR